MLIDIFRILRSGYNVDTLQELNTFIEKIQNNVDFAAMLDDNNQNELDAYYSLTQALKKIIGDLLIVILYQMVLMV